MDAHKQAQLQAESAPDTPQPNALGPDVMRQEFINIAFAKSGGKLTTTKASEIVDAILRKQMEFYAAIAVPELDASQTNQYQVVMDGKGIVAALIHQGAAVAEFMPDKAKWQRLAARAREWVTRMEGMFS